MIRLIIDTDPGVDDAHAIMAAAAYPGARIEAVTTVKGNVSLERTTANACTILDVMGINAPVYAGCGKALVAEHGGAEGFHGADGLGDSAYPPSPRKVESEHAVHALIRLANAEPGALTLVTLGPLTNLALALRLDPSLPRKFRRLVVMGGAIRGMGNTTLTAEFNFHADPEAAAIVLRDWGPLTLVSWETTVEHPFSEAQVRALLALDSPRAEFLRRISQGSLAFLEHLFGRPVMLEPDLLAVAAALEPEIVRRKATHYVAVELSGALTRGQTCVDWYDVSGKQANIELALEMDADRVYELLQAALK
ncbi:MAG: nucleoside hydrolase [Anaerolineae bacterium]|jgi:purine nucleosidase|nr:nucleoside hydrolase [Anaerolineae bacterium]